MYEAQKTDLPVRRIRFCDASDPISVVGVSIIEQTDAKDIDCGHLR